ncbi:GDP-mannose--glycolipid 4-beta-D-mannosyltransferase [Amnibacterium soli]|uniref:GDP-mannose--glycolipid 4-beta-D-mannosyltransferase n=1 Tax=Amnibacterium soli TaxID=1282736 RepID=A0ABP8ZDF7_9MICO
MVQRQSGRIVVQQSFPPPRPTTNPYIVMLRDALAGDSRIALRTFSWRSALLGRYDLFHAHWPEILVSGRGRLRTAVRQALFALLLVRLTVTRTPVVRTVHNLELPSGISPVQRHLLLAFERRTTARIALNADTPADDGTVVVLHGHYRHWFERYPEPETIPGRVTYFGLIRRYKNVEALVHAFRSLPGRVSLEVAGSPSSAELERGIRAAAGDDGRVHLRFAYLTDAELVETCGRGQLVVLPYLHMHNSGGVLAALSLDRPVLVPRNAANDALAAEVGEVWVQRYEGELSSEALDAALAATATISRGMRPDLDARSWPAGVDGHVRAYRLALGRRYSR